MLNLPATLVALTVGLVGALPAPSWAQPAKPKPAAAAAQDDPAGEVQESAGAGKKVKTEGQKAEGGKAKPKPAEENDEETRPGASGKPGSSPPPGSAPSRDR